MGTLTGRGHYALSSTNSFSGEILAEPSSGTLSFGQQAVGATATANKQVASTLSSSGTVVTLFARVPIAGWSNTNVIVGSFAGVPAVPGYQGNVDTFSVSFGATATTACSSANGVICPYSDGVGTQANVTHGASTGLYNLVTTKTYSKLKCVGSAYTASGEAWLRGASGGPINCTSCATAPFTVVLYNTASTPDGFGTISCQGIY